ADPPFAPAVPAGADFDALPGAPAPDAPVADAPSVLFALEALAVAGAFEGAASGVSDRVQLASVLPELAGDGADSTSAGSSAAPGTASARPPAHNASAAVNAAIHASGVRDRLVETPAPVMLHDASFVLELLQMRAHRICSGRMQILRNVDVDFLDYL